MNHDISTQARFYDWENEQFFQRQLRDIEFYQHVIKDSEGDVLELCCGTGRITKDLATNSHIVTLDNDQYMLRIADEVVSSGNIQFVCADMVNFDLNQKFGAILIPYNSFQYLLEQERQIAYLKIIKRHLKIGGVLAFELNPFQVNIVPHDWLHQATAPLA